MNLVDIFVGISEVWLKRRFQNDALGRTRLGLGSKGKTRMATKKEKKVGKAKVPKLNLSQDGPGDEVEEARSKPRPKTARSGPQVRVYESLSDERKTFSCITSEPLTPSNNLPCNSIRSLQSSRSASEIHSSIAGIATEFPEMWQSLSERGTLRTGDGTSEKKLTRLEQTEKRMQDERAAKKKADYRRMLKDRLVALKRKDILTAKKQMFRSRGALHAERVRNIKVKQQAEKLRRQQLSFRLRRQNLVETRMRKLNLSMIRSLHSSKREQVRTCESRSDE